MAPVSLKLLTTIGFLISDVSSVSITAETTVIRSEKKFQEVRPSGEIREVELEMQPSGATEPELGHGDAAGVTNEMCSLDFPLGPEGDCKCADEAKHELILEEDICMEAARQAGVSAPWLTFRLHAEWYNHHPKGCFKQSCTQDPKGICYFFNPVGDNPAKCANRTKLVNGDDAPAVTGQPVCKRPKYQNGTMDSNVGCPAGYANIIDHDTCVEAAVCKGLSRGTEFRVTSKNQSRHDDFPTGCFVSSSDGKAYFNPPLENWLAPHSPKGKPLCNNSDFTFFKAAEGGAGTAGADISDRAGEASTATTTTAAPAAEETTTAAL